MKSPLDGPKNLRETSDKKNERDIKFLELNFREDLSFMNGVSEANVVK